jgi:aspartate/tyrosine/aromatic aminotransferase
MFFDDVKEAPSDPIFGLAAAFNKDTRLNKVSLAVGIYQNEKLESTLFESAKIAKELIFSEDLMANYLPIDGFRPMLDLLAPVVFGSALWAQSKERIYAAQTPGGTGALCIGAEFLAGEVSKKVSIPNRTWPNHKAVFGKAGFEIERYPYYSKEKKGFDLQAVLDFFSKLAPKTIVVLHACCHNPTGCDPTLEEWKELSRAMKSKNLVPFFDFAYQGLGDGLEIDAGAVRLFVEEGHEMLVAYSCSKNFSMYGQRVGALFAVNGSDGIKTSVGSQIKRIIRAIYSNPPAHGARIVERILRDSELKKLWEKDLADVRMRVDTMRQLLIQRLSAKSKDMDLAHLKKHKGMFSFIELNQEQVQTLIDKYAVYLSGSGRINVAGLNAENIDYVVDSIIHSI